MNKNIVLLLSVLLLTTGVFAVQDASNQQDIQTISEDQESEAHEHHHRVDVYSLRALGSFLTVVFSILLVNESRKFIRTKGPLRRSAISALLGGFLMGTIFLIEILRYDFGLILEEEAWHQLRYFLTAGAVGFVTYAYIVISAIQREKIKS